ncbi:MAG: hypothetical protein ABSG67_01450 [Thermoguttaceae bacterium]|jgi:hypothetical protein
MTNSALQTSKEALAALASEPSLDLARQRSRTHVSLETTDYSYRLTLLNERLLKVEIVSNDRRIGVRSIGFFERSVYDEEGSVFLAGRIVSGMRMQIRFANGVFCSRPVVSATVCGDGWHYRVF